MSSVSFNLPQPGIWTVQGEFAGQIVTQQVEITEKGATVPITLTFDAATITVTSPVGTSLLLTDGTNQLTAVSTGTNTFTIYNMGQWTVSGTLEGYTLNTETVTVTDGNNYPVQLSIQIAALTVTAPVGTVVTVSGGGASQQETATTGTVVFNLTQLDTYTVSGTLGELISETETVQVTAFQPYSVTLTINSATIMVYTIPGTLVTVQNGGTTLTGTAEGDTGQVSFAVQIFGVWNVSGALEGYTFTPTTVDVQAYQEYGVNLDPLVATITVTAPAGTEVVAEDSTSASETEEIKQAETASTPVTVENTPAGESPAAQSAEEAKADVAPSAELVEDTASAETADAEPERSDMITEEIDEETDQPADEAAETATASYTPDMPVEEICARMTLEEAQNYIVDTGTCKGWPLSQVAERRPASLRFYVNGYQGDNNILRAGAKLLLNNMEAMNIAS